jgi:hypothetical protein
MHAFLTAVMLACCGVGIVCPLLEGRGRGGILRSSSIAGNAAQWGPMALMLVAMVDTSVGPGLLPGVVWGLLLLLAAPLPLALLPRARRSAMEFHRSLSLLGMFALLVTSLQPEQLRAAGQGAQAAAHQLHAHAGAGSTAALLAMVLAAAAAAYSALLAVRMLKSGKPSHPVEAFASAGALGAMLLMAF